MTSPAGAAAAAVTALAERFHDAEMAADPLAASLLGDHRFGDRLPDWSAEAEARRASSLRDMAAELDALAVGELSGQAGITAAMLRFELERAVGICESALPEFTVAPAMIGPQAVLVEACSNMTLPTPEVAEALVDRYRRVDAFLGGACDRLRDGVKRGRTPVARAVGQVVRQIDDYLAAPVDSDPLLDPSAPAAWGSADARRWADALRAAVTEVVRPALRDYRDCLAEQIAPAARGEDRSGMVALPDGDRVYAMAIRRSTSVDATPDDLHALGLEVVAGLEQEYRDAAQHVLGTTDLAEIFARLRDDPSLRFDDAAQVRGAAESALRRAEAAVPRWFGRLPATPCVVRDMPAHEVRDGTIAYYLPPAEDRSRPGAYLVNTWDPTTRTRFESEALAFHEAVPGHHLQIALAAELTELPRFRRLTAVNAYVEGWALYTERLSDEMGLYSGPLERLGMLAFDSWRSCRLVVDTGIHARGWSRRQAVAYLREHSPLAPNNIENEVDRYISWPGQALGYKVGQLEILRLRAAAQQRLGDGFDIAGFHDAVLGSGAVPLPVLADLVDEWVESRRSDGQTGAASLR